MAVLEEIHSTRESKPARTCLFENARRKRKWEIITQTGTATDRYCSLRALKEKLKAQRKHLDDLDAHIAELESEKGGEQH